ncbi:MAG: HNH endonuclease [bacterium]
MEEQNITIAGSQDIQIIQAGGDVHYYEAERPQQEEREEMDIKGLEPNTSKKKEKGENQGSAGIQAIRNELKVEAMHRCCLCLQHENIIEIHHIVPISEGGPDTEENLIVVCPNCHTLIHQPKTMYTPKQLRMYKKKWVSFCAKGFPLETPIPNLHNQTPLEPRLIHITEPEPNWVGRKEELARLNQCYQTKEIRVVALVGWGGFGKTTIARKWYEELSKNNIFPDGIFGWSFYKNRSQDAFLEASLDYLSQGNPEVRELRNAPARFAKLEEYLNKGKFLFILDGLEEIQEDNQSDKFGKMKDTSMQGFLQSWAGGAIRESFCLITTRFPMTDLKDCKNKGYEPINIEELKKEDGIELFKKRGVKGGNDELGRLVNEYGGHALSLTLVAGFLNDFCNGEAKMANEIPFYEMKDEENKTLRILKAYDERLTQGQQVFLQIFSCFLRPIDDDAISQVFRKEIRLDDGRVFNESLISIPDFEFKQMIHHLEERRLIYKGTTHPIIRGYFEKSLSKEARMAINRRLYHYTGGLAPEQPETLEEMQPLFEQVYHGCSAGMYDEVFNDVYREKIYRMEERFITHKLGAWETNLSLVKMFFPNSDLSKMPLVSKKDAQSFLFNEAGLALLNTGRPKEAEEPFLTGVKMTIEAKDWKNASMGYQNLADLQFRTGRLKESLETVKEALKMTEEAKFDKYIVYSKAYLAWIFYLLGKTKEAENCFREADELEKKISGDRLYSLRGVQYADFLISIKRTDEALKLTLANLKICQNVLKNPNDICRCHRILSAIERIKGNKKEARIHLQNSLEIAKRVGMPFLEIEALLESGRLHLDMERYENAISDANYVLKLCSRTGFLLYEPDAELILAKAYLSVECSVHDTACIDTVDALQNKAKSLAQSAYDKADLMGYHLPKLEAIELANKFKE